MLPTTSYYDTQQVCLNGHQITDSLRGSPQSGQEFCSECGAKAIHQCPQCAAEIRGHFNSETVVYFSAADIPSNCHKCGKAYPWTEQKAKAEVPWNENTERDSLLPLHQILSRFHLFVRQLRVRRDGRPCFDVTDEYDVQDLLHALLRLFFDDVRPEEYTPSYAGKSSRMDFLLKKESTVIEVKMTRPGLSGKEVGSQLIEDIARYTQHQNCRRLVCFVYDPEGLVANPEGLESDLSRTEDRLRVQVFVVPRGH